MQTQDQPPVKSKLDRKFLFITGRIVLAFCCLVVVVLVGLAIQKGLSDSRILFGPRRIVLSGTTPSSGGPVVGSRGSELLQSDTWKAILNYYKSARDCTDVVNTQIKVVHGIDSSGTWEEAWTIDACGMTNLAGVIYSENRELGGTDFHIDFSDSAPPINGPAQGGQADKFLKYFVWSMIEAGYAQYYKCDNVSSQEIDVVNPPESSPSGAWTEAWTVNACGNTIHLQLEFKPNTQTGGVDYTIPLHP